MATQVQMNIAPTVTYPQVVIRDREDARTLVRILQRNGIAVNLREVDDDHAKPPLGVFQVPEEPS